MKTKIIKSIWNNAVAQVYELLIYTHTQNKSQQQDANLSIWLSWFILMHNYFVVVIVVSMKWTSSNKTARHNTADKKKCEAKVKHRLKGGKVNFWRLYKNFVRIYYVQWQCTTISVN